MKITPEQKSNIQKAFQKMNSKNDFLALLNEVKQMEYGKKCHPFTEKQLNYYINKDKFASDFDVIQALFPEEATKKNLIHTGQGYTTFTVKKKSGGTRTIHAPQKGLKEFQKALNTILQNLHEPHKAATGFVLNKSIVDNAKVHVGQKYVYNLDLKDFFPSVDKSRVWGRLLVAPFHLGNSDERKKIANMIAALCCTKMEVERYENNAWIKKICAVLPQGAPTSPTLTNAICEKMDIRLAGVAKRFGLKYTRYADDITFSSNHNNYEVTPNNFEKIFLSNSTFDMEVRRIIADQNFHVKESKVRLQKEGFRQEVTGLVVNDKVNVTRRYVKQLRQWLYYWETYGYDKAYKFFLQKYVVEKGHVKKGKPNMIMVIGGKLLYLKMVKGANDSTYLSLKKRYDSLVNIENKNVFKNNTHKKNIVDLIFEIGLDEAMKKF